MLSRFPLATFRKPAAASVEHYPREREVTVHGDVIMGERRG